MYDYECGSSTLVDSVTIGGWNTVATDGTAAVVVVCVCKMMGAELLLLMVLLLLLLLVCAR